MRERERERRFGRGPIARAPPSTGLHRQRHYVARGISRAETAKTGAYHPYGEAEIGIRREERGTQGARRGLPLLDDGGGSQRVYTSRNRGGGGNPSRKEIDAYLVGGENPRRKLNHIPSRRTARYVEVCKSCLRNACGQDILRIGDPLPSPPPPPARGAHVHRAEARGGHGQVSSGHGQDRLRIGDPLLPPSPPPARGGNAQEAETRSRKQKAEAFPPPPPLPARGDNVQEEESRSSKQKAEAFPLCESSYAQVAQKETEVARLKRVEDDDSGLQKVRNRRELRQQPVTDMAGRCYRCLGKGHFARECRDPVVCRACMRTGHRQKDCMNQDGLHRHAVGHRSAVMEGMAACLVGEVQAGTPTTATILQGLPINDTPSGQPECFQLDSGGFLLRGLSEKMYRELWGVTQVNTEGDKIQWRRPLATDGAQMFRHEIIKLAVWGVPFGQ